MEDATNGVEREFLPSFPGWRFGLLHTTDSQLSLVQSAAMRLHERVISAYPSIQGWISTFAGAKPFLDSLGILTQTLAGVGGKPSPSPSRFLEEWAADALDDTVTEVLAQRREFQRLLQTCRHGSKARYHSALDELTSVAAVAASDVVLDPQLLHQVEHLASELVQEESLRQDALLWLYLGWARMGQGYQGQPVDEPLFQAVLLTAQTRGVLRPLALHGLAWSRINSCTFEEAIAIAQRALEYSDDAQSRGLMAVGLGAKGLWDEALVHAEVLGRMDLLSWCDLLCEWARHQLVPPGDELLQIIHTMEEQNRDAIRTVATDWNTTIQRVKRVQELAVDRVQIPAPLLDDLPRVTGQAGSRGLFEVVACQLQAESMHRELARVAKAEVERFRRAEMGKVEAARSALQAAWEEREGAVRGAFQAKTQHDADARRSLEESLGRPEDNQKGCYLLAGLGCAGFVLYILIIALSTAMQWPLTATSPIGLGLLGLAMLPIVLGFFTQVALVVKRSKVEAALAALRAQAQQAYESSVAEADKHYRKTLPKLREELAEAEAQMNVVDQVAASMTGPLPDSRLGP